MNEASGGCRHDAGRPANRRLRITYLLADTALSGGAKVTLHQANLLAARGHRVTVVSLGERPAWFAVMCDFRRVTSWDKLHLADEDVVVATFWTTIAPAMAAAPGRVVHYCQGLEWTFTHNLADHAAIREAYAQPLPAMTVTPHLARLLADEYDRRAAVVPPPLGGDWRPRPRMGRHRRPRVVVMQPFEIDWKGVPTAIEALRRLRELGVPVRTVRISQWPLPAAEEALLMADERYVNVPPSDVAAILRGADLLLAPSWEQEGFGLHVLEAMACGVPVVASDIPSFRFSTAGAARLVPPGDAAAFAAAASTVLTSRGEWRRRRRLGLAAAQRFSEQSVADAAEAVMIDLAGGTPTDGGVWSREWRGGG